MVSSDYFYIIVLTQLYGFNLKPYNCVRTTSNNTSSSSSLCRTASTNIPDPLSLPVSIVHLSRKIFNNTPSIGTELFYIGSSWSSSLCSSMWKGPQEYVAYEFVSTSPAVSYMSGSSN